MRLCSSLPAPSIVRVCKMPRNLDPFRGKKTLGSANKAQRRGRKDRPKGMHQSGFPFSNEASLVHPLCYAHTTSANTQCQPAWLRKLHEYQRCTCCNRLKEPEQQSMGLAWPGGWHGCSLDFWGAADWRSEKGEGQKGQAFAVQIAGEALEVYRACDMQDGVQVYIHNLPLSACLSYVASNLHSTAHVHCLANSSLNGDEVMSLIKMVCVLCMQAHLRQTDPGGSQKWLSQ